MRERAETKTAESAILFLQFAFVLEVALWTMVFCWGWSDTVDLVISLVLAVTVTEFTFAWFVRLLVMAVMPFVIAYRLLRHLLSR